MRGVMEEDYCCLTTRVQETEQVILRECKIQKEGKRVRNTRERESECGKESERRQESQVSVLT